MFSNAKEGWTCAKCGRSYAPFVRSCEQCNTLISYTEQNTIGPSSKVEIPESAKKPKVEWEFPCYGKRGDMDIYFFEYGTGREVKTGEMFYKLDMDKCTPCTLEAKDI